MRFPAQAGSVKRVLKTYPSRMSIPASGLEVPAYLGSYCNTQKVYKPDILVLDDLHLVDKPKPTHIVSELLLCRTLVQLTKVYISAHVALLDHQLHLHAHRGRLPPANLELLSVQRQLLNCRVGMEGSSSGCIKERHDFLGRTRIDLSGPKWTRFNSSSTDAVAGRLPTYTVHLIGAFGAPERAAERAAGEYASGVGRIFTFRQGRQGCCAKPYVFHTKRCTGR